MGEDVLVCGIHYFRDATNPNRRDFSESCTPEATV